MRMRFLTKLTLITLHRTVLLGFVLFLGAMVFQHVEQLDYNQALTLTWTVVTTIGLYLKTSILINIEKFPLESHYLLASN